MKDKKENIVMKENVLNDETFDWIREIAEEMKRWFTEKIGGDYMSNRSKECIEFRNDHESKCYLVNSDTKQTGFQRIPLSQGYEEYGNGNKMYFFEAVGKYDSSILDIIHANNIEEAQELINERYKERFKRNTIISFPIKELVDERWY